MSSFQKNITAAHGARESVRLRSTAEQKWNPGACKWVETRWCQVLEADNGDLLPQLWRDIGVTVAEAALPR